MYRTGQGGEEWSGVMACVSEGAREGQVLVGSRREGLYLATWCLSSGLGGVEGSLRVRRLERLLLL